MLIAIWLILILRFHQDLFKLSKDLPQFCLELCSYYIPELRSILDGIAEVETCLLENRLLLFVFVKITLICISWKLLQEMKIIVCGWKLPKDPCFGHDKAAADSSWWFPKDSFQFAPSIFTVNTACFSLCYAHGRLTVQTVSHPFSYIFVTSCVVWWFSYSKCIQALVDIPPLLTQIVTHWMR